MPAARIFLTDVSLKLNARLGRAGRKSSGSESYRAIANAIEEARSALDRCANGEGVGRGFLNGASEDAGEQLREIRDRLISLEASARIARLSAETAAADERETVQVQIGAPGVRLLEFAQAVEEWIHGERPMPEGGPSEPLRSALGECAFAFRRAAWRNRAIRS